MPLHETVARLREQRQGDEKGTWDDLGDFINELGQQANPLA